MLDILTNRTYPESHLTAKSKSAFTESPPAEMYFPFTMRPQTNEDSITSFTLYILLGDEKLCKGF